MESDKEVLLLISVEIELLNRRFSTASFVDDATLLHLPKFGRQEDECNDPVSNHGAFKAANKKLRKVLDGADLFCPSLDFCYMVNFLCRECLEASDAHGHLSIRKSPLKRIRK